MRIWRGVPLDLRKEYIVGKTYTWWGFSSCTESISVLESDLFLGQEGKRTMFSIDCFNGKKVREHSSFEDENEILILPGSQFLVKSHLQPSKKDPDLVIIQLEQVEPPFVLLEEPSPGMATYKSSSMVPISAKDTPRGEYNFLYHQRSHVTKIKCCTGKIIQIDIKSFFLPMSIFDHREQLAFHSRLRFWVCGVLSFLVSMIISRASL